VAAFGIAVMLIGSGCAASSKPTVYVSVPSFIPTPTPRPTQPPTPTPDPSVTPTPDPSFTPWVSPSDTPTPATGTWTLNLYNSKAIRYQNPDMTACTATASQVTLNMALYWTDYKSLDPDVPDPARPPNWKVTTSYASQEAILAFERKNTTQTLRDGGADAHGWRNALNYFGWGHNSAGMFSDQTYPTFDAASRAAVRAIALFRKPVGILAWGGQHAQVMTGYRVTGQDPRTGATKWTLQGIYLFDPLVGDHLNNVYITRNTWGFDGGKKIKFVPYTMTNSPYVDPLDGQQGNAEWDGKYVIVAPIA
jgi:hypothetical protein